MVHFEERDRGTDNNSKAMEFGANENPARAAGLNLLDVPLQLAKNVEDIFVIGLLIQRVHL
jgi:hypothetical protein